MNWRQKIKKVMIWASEPNYYRSDYKTCKARTARLYKRLEREGVKHISRENTNNYKKMHKIPMSRRCR